MPVYDLVCKNGHEQLNLILKMGERPPCPICSSPTETLWRDASGVKGDDIPGGVEIRHGLCNPDGTPRKYYSHSEINAEAKRRGYANIVTHVTEPGTDKARYTTRWTSAPTISEEERVENWHKHEEMLRMQEVESKSKESV